MFGKKSSSPSQPPQPWALQALTLNYLIDGFVEPNGEVQTLLIGGPNYYERRYVLSLTEAKVQPVGNLAFAPFSCERWTLEHRWGLVAIIPKDDLSTQIIKNIAKESQYTYRIVMYAGPFIIRATVMPPTQFHAFESYAFMPAKDAVIDCMIPGSLLTGLNAPWIVVNREMWEGFVPG